jgi:hypothetical protein
MTNGEPHISFGYTLSAFNTPSGLVKKAEEFRSTPFSGIERFIGGAAEPSQKANSIDLFLTFLTDLAGSAFVPIHESQSLNGHVGGHVELKFGFIRCCIIYIRFT